MAPRNDPVVAVVVEFGGQDGCPARRVRDSASARRSVESRAAVRGPPSGVFQRHGVAIERVSMPEGAKALTALLSGDVDLAEVSRVNVLRPKARDGPSGSWARIHARVLGGRRDRRRGAGPAWRICGAVARGHDHRLGQLGFRQHRGPAAGPTRPGTRSSGAAIRSLISYASTRARGSTLHRWRDQEMRVRGGGRRLERGVGGRWVCAEPVSEACGGVRALRELGTITDAWPSDER